MKFLEMLEARLFEKASQSPDACMVSPAI